MKAAEEWYASRKQNSAGLQKQLAGSIYNLALAAFTSSAVTAPPLFPKLPYT